MKKIEGAFWLLGLLTIIVMLTVVIVNNVAPWFANIGWTKVSDYESDCEVLIDGDWEWIGDIQYIKYNYSPMSDINTLQLKDLDGYVYRVVSPDPIKYFCVGE